MGDREYIEKLVEAMAEAIQAPISEETIDTDAVCKECRNRIEHSWNCSLIERPWPTITVEREPTPPEAARAALAAMLAHLSDALREGGG